jgi:hypothetical protein
MINHRKQFILIIVTLLCLGFLLTSFASYYVSRSSLITKIKTSELPLTSDNIYSEIQKDLLQPIFVSSLMASDTFLRDWIIQGEKDEKLIRKYLVEIQRKYHTTTSFLISERSQTYYHFKAKSRKVDTEDAGDKWYIRAKDMVLAYETNVDFDSANDGTMTIFVNYKVFDYDGKFLGITGIGLTVDSVKKSIHRYQTKYQRNIYFTDLTGNIILHCQDSLDTTGNIRDIEGLAPLADTLLSNTQHSASFQRHGQTIHINSRFIPELDWYLLVEQKEDIASSAIFKTLLTNILICVVVTLLVIWLINFTVRAYRTKLDDLAAHDEELQKRNHHQAKEISAQNKELTQNNRELKKALSKVNQLSGFLPICASCKKIRDDQGYWNQIETYIEHHSEAEFSHSICPECTEKLYPEISKDKE